MTWDDVKKLKLRVYSTATCPDCHRLKAVFAREGVSYTEVDIDKEAGAADDLVRRTGKRAIPYIEVAGTKMIRGYHKEAPGRWNNELFLAEVEAAVRGSAG